ncbi:hypothetical protein [Frateuria defendens]|uniref:hypothetical protein n=1 Tax=Frateuria defendens TaxID=2219559 RepID=UPI000B0D9948|nr:hypothetical protein [Frateuria defendens]
MRGWIFLVAMAFAAQAGAQGYEFLRYRINDPFVFCTQGQINPDKCWWPMPPYTGAFMQNPSCDPPNPYGRSWTAADWDSLGQYQQVCPQAITSGAWTGTVPPESTPFEH